MNNRITFPSGVRYIADNKVRDWTPSEITTQGWWDASDASTIIQADAVGRVSALNDKSGNANHVAQTTPANQPNTGTQTIGGKNVVEFIQANAMFLTRAHASCVGLDMDVSNGHSCFSVGRRGSFLNIGSGINSMWGKGDTASGNIGYGMVWTSDTSFTMKAGVNRSSSLGSYLNQDGIFGMVNSTTGIAGEGYFRGYLNATRIFNLTGGTGLSNNTQPFYMGRDNNALRYSNCWIGELIIIAGAVSDSVRQKVEGYLAWKWGMQSQLVEGHPYKLYAPYVTKV